MNNLEQALEGVKYNHDVYILPSGQVEGRKYGHTFTRGRVEHVLKGTPGVVFIGKGTSGMASLSPDARALLGKKGVRIIKADMPDMVDEFNELAKTRRVAAIVHVTR